MPLSIVVPILNEGATLAEQLQRLQPLRCAGHQLILVDGGSSDDSVEAAIPLVDSVVHSAPGRAVQMNRGASDARHPTLLFLHADTHLPHDVTEQVEGAMALGDWGRFDVALSGQAPLLRVVERMINWRSRLTGIATGDQAIFIKRSLFVKMGGFAEIPLMEDIELCRRLKRMVGPPVAVTAQVVTSSRRWEQGGIWRTILLMWSLRLRYYLGADPALLARRYRNTRVGRGSDGG